MTALRHLVHLLRGTWFRRLFAVRIASQLTDGVFQAALAAYVVFSPERAPTPGAIAAALAVVLLPFSALGPFVGVFLDRWSRRQVLARANFARVGLVALLAVAVHADLRGPLLFAMILVCLSVNRFLLAGLSAALPHVVAREDLVTANALTPTAGTLAALVGAGIGTLAHGLLGSDVGVLLLAAALFGVAGLLALRIPRDLLGPDVDPEHPGVREAVGNAARGLVEGLRHLEQRRPAAYGLTAIGAHRFFYGVSTVALILLYRNYFHDSTEVDAAFAQLSLALLVSGAGFVTAAVLTPLVTERVSQRTWVLALLVGAAVTQVVPGALYTQPALLVSAFFLGLASQGIKIVVDTLVQTNVDDEFRGRVFSLYDVIFNVAFVAAAAVAGAVLPRDGKSYVVLGLVAAGYGLTAAWYARVTRVAREVPATT
ncbi:MAG: MFS transporter [Nocardioidaceae bacterium]|nr:MFS transporter [Nocardioidaceae bacterium]NUS53170.1 MFS transporter [Nocardioidaceae bacterium]